MKKLMIAAAIVCAAALSQAATIDWASDFVYVPADSTGVKGEDFGDFNMYAFVIDKNAYDTYAALSYAEASKQIWADFGTGSAIDAATLASNAGSTQRYTSDGAAYAMTTLTEDVTDASGLTYRAFILTTGNPEDGEFYIANIDVADVGGSGSYMGVNSSAATVWGGTAGGSIDSWNTVPEPTSGLLLLLGVAGLALKRKRA